MIVRTRMFTKQAPSLLAFVLLVLSQWQHVVSEFFEPTYSKNGFMLQNHVVKTKSAIQSLFACYTECEHSQSCFSINYYSGTLICQFNNASHVSHPHDVIPASNASYLHIENKIPPYCMLNVSTALGMESDTIPDSAITASSHIGFGYAPYRARLNHSPALPYNKYKDTACWCCASPPAAGQYLQIDLGRVVRVSMVATQGRPAWYQNQYVSKYRLAYKQGSSPWTDYKEENVIKVFTGNSHSELVATNQLKEKAELKLIRFIAVEWNLHVCMRVEVYGCYLS